jgi:hypothetical protein
VGPSSDFQEFPALSVMPSIVTGRPFHEGWLERNTTMVEAPAVLNDVVV